MTSIPLFTSHHNPHCSPLGNENRLNDTRNLIDKCDRSGDVVKNFDIADLFPGHWHVLKQFNHRVGHVFQCSKINSLKKIKLNKLQFDIQTLS